MDSVLELTRRLMQSSPNWTLTWLTELTPWLANPWARAIGLSVIVYFTIRVIASVYAGNMQNSELGPLGLRPHAPKRLGRDSILLPRRLMPMNMEGVHANCRVYYTFVDASGRRRKQLVHSIAHARISISPVALATVAATVYGQEIPDVATEDVCFPPVDLEQIPAGVATTPERAQDYAALHKIIENWREDDEAHLISVHPNVHEEIKEAREQFIIDEAGKVRRARQGNVLARWISTGVARKRPNVVGSYYVKFEFSRNPFFVLTRHPDRELKMTAWLTVLTSMFALIMDAWPTEAMRPGASAPNHHASPPPSRPSRSAASVAPN